MLLSLTDHIETILNPEGRFRTLGKITPVVEQSGDPRLYNEQGLTLFHVAIDGVPSVVACGCTNIATAERLRLISTYTCNISGSYIAPHSYLPGEMLVFDNSGNPCYTDVMTYPLPAGERLDLFLKNRCAAADTRAITVALGNLASLARWLHRNEFAHNDVCGRNIYISGSGELVMVNCFEATPGPPAEDIAVIAALTAAIYTVCGNPEAYGHLLSDRLAQKHSLLSFMPLLADILDSETDGLLKQAVSLGTKLHTQGSSALKGIDLTETLDLIEELALSEPRPLETIGEMIGFITAGTAINGGAFDFIGPYSTLMRARDGMGWCYIDHSGKKVIPGPFLSATDFGEGRAVVETAEGFGLIDEQGRTVIHTVYDDMEWLCHDNIVYATLVGKSSIFDRAGNTLAIPQYDLLLPPSEGLIPAKKDGLYGYLHRDGTVAIDFTFQDAFGFSGGFARVVRNGQVLLIDHEGKTINQEQSHFGPVRNHAIPE